MTIDWHALLQELGKTAVIVAALAWLAQSVIKHWLARDIEGVKNTLTLQANTKLQEVKTTFALQLAAEKHQADRDLEHYRASLGLQHFLQDIKPEQDCRWKRLQAMHHALDAVQQRCEELLNLSPANHTTPPQPLQGSTPQPVA